MKWICLLLLICPSVLLAQWQQFEIDGVDDVYDLTEAGDTVLLCAKGGLLRSVDKGKNWKKILSFPDGLPLSILKTTEKLWIGAGSGLYTSQDKGQSWQRVSPPELRYVGALAQTSEGAIVAAPYSKGSAGSTLPGNGSVYVSRNQGQTWSNLIYELQNPQEAFGIQTTPAGVYLYSSSGIYQSNPAVSSWTKISLPAVTKNCLAATLSPDKQYLNAAVETVFGTIRFFAKSISATEWVELPLPPTALAFPKITSFSSRSSGYELAFLAANQGAYALSLDWQGNQLLSAAWTQIFNSAPPFSHREGWLVADAKVKFIQAVGERLFCSTQSALYQINIRHPNFPDAWQRVSTPTLTATNGMVKQLDTLVVAAQGLPLSTDKGKTWVSSLSADIQVHQVRKVGSFIFAATSAGLLRLEKGRWQAFARGQPAARVWDIHPYQQGLLLAIENQGLFWIRNLQNNSAVNITTATALSVNNINLITSLGDTVIANLVSGTQQGLYRGIFSQGNWSWERIFGIAVKAMTGTTLEGQNLLVVAANWSAGTPITPSGGDFFNTQIIVSTNGGRSWNLLLSKQNRESVISDPNYVATNSHSIQALAAIENRIYASVFDAVRNKGVALIEIIWDTEFKTGYYFDFSADLGENFAQDLRIDRFEQSDVLLMGAANGAPALRVIRSDVPTSIDKPQAVKIYPNPSANVIHFEAENTIINIEIFDITGQKIMDCQKSTLDVSGLKIGCYIAHIQTQGRQKFIYRVCKQ